jgi:hypothetical protein
LIDLDLIGQAAQFCDFVGGNGTSIAKAINEAVSAPQVPAPLTGAQCRARFEAWYSSAPDAEPEPERTYELTDESMSELTKDCIWLGWQAAHGITGEAQG